MSHLAAVFARCRAESRAAFVPFLTGGDPDLETCEELLYALAAAGADVIELGVPFSDPIADGPVIQASSVRARRSGVTLGRLLALVARTRGRLGVPIVLFTYSNPLFAFGFERFAEQAAASGVDGVLCVDLPPEEAAAEYLPALRRADLDTIFLLAPTSTKARIKAVAAASRGFVYYVSRTGVTGEREELPAGLAKEVAAVRRAVGLPVAVGFGISTPAQAEAVAAIGDGVVVGSALVHLVAELLDEGNVAALLAQRARQFAAVMTRPEPRGLLGALRRR